MIANMLFFRKMLFWCLFQELERRAKALRDKHEDLRREVAQRQLEVRYLMQQLMFTEPTRAFISLVLR